jgi:hypothetical protein
MLTVVQKQLRVWPALFNGMQGLRPSHLVSKTQRVVEGGVPIGSLENGRNIPDASPQEELRSEKSDHNIQQNR